MKQGIFPFNKVQGEGFAFLARTGDGDFVVTGQMQGVAARRQDADHQPLAVLPVVVVRVVVRAGPIRPWHRHPPGYDRARRDRRDEGLQPLELLGGPFDRIIVGRRQASSMVGNPA